MVKSPQFRDNIIQQKFIPRQYRFRDFFELREKLIDHPEIFEYLTDESQKAYIKFCYENNIPEYQDIESVKDAEQTLINKINYKNRKSQQIFQEFSMAQGYKVVDGLAAEYYFVATKNCLFQTENYPWGQGGGGPLSITQITVNVVNDFVSSMTKPQKFTADAADLGTSDFYLLATYAELKRKANLPDLGYETLEHLQNFWWYYVQGNEVEALDNIAFKQNLQDINEQNRIESIIPEKIIDVPIEQYKDLWYKGEFPKTPWMHMAYYDGWSFYIPNHTVVSNKMTHKYQKFGYLWCVRPNRFNPIPKEGYLESAWICVPFINVVAYDKQNIAMMNNEPFHYLPPQPDNIRNDRELKRMFTQLKINGKRAINLDPIYIAVHKQMYEKQAQIITEQWEELQISSQFEDPLGITNKFFGGGSA